MESQIENSDSEKRSPITKKKKKALGPAEVETVRKRGTLLLSKTRVLHDLEHAQNPRYEKMLRAALAHLDDQLSQLC